MKKIYFVQVGFAFDGSVYLPYAAGTIIANCQADPWIQSEYEFTDIIFQRERLATALGKIQEPYLVAFSCSVWNIEYNKALATRVKEIYPRCIIVFGGHSVSEDAGLLSECPAIDFLMFGEGEATFAELLHGLADSRLQNVHAIAYRDADHRITRTPRQCIEKDLPYPSPYLTHVFDKIMRENPDKEFLAVLETNRGCPYACTYCDWVSGKKMRFFPMEKITAEIEWFGIHKIAYCFGADSNFGMFSRDSDITEALIAAKKKYGYPEVFRTCYEKNSADRVFEICCALNRVGMDKGATISYQTLSPTALKNIGRKNLTMEHFSALLKKYNEAGIPAYSELILGLPGETRESFCAGICKILESGQHNSLSIYTCEMLPNSDMAQPDYIKKHGIQVIKVAFNHIHSAPKQDEEVQEYSYLVRSTATMPPDDWVSAQLFSACIQCFHSLGVLRCFALYLYSEHIASYYDFYNGLLSYIMNGSGKLSDLWHSFQTKYENSLAGDWNYYNKSFGNVTWFFEEGAFLEIISDLDACMEALVPYLMRFDLSPAFFEQLMRYQKLILRKPFVTEEHGIFDYDFPAYFDSIIKGNYAPLKSLQTTVRIQPRTRYDSIPAYAKEIVWFGRRRGATVYNAQEITVEQKK